MTVAVALESVCLAFVIYMVVKNLKQVTIKKRIFDSRYFKKLKNKNNVLKNIDVLLARSGLKNKLPFINAENLLIINAVIFIVSIFLFRELGFAAVFYAAAALYIPYAGMMFLSSMNAKKIKETYLSFLTTFIGFYNIEGNIINTLKSTAPYISEPLKSIITRNIFAYEKTQMSVDMCLENIAVEAGNREFRKFINFAKLNTKYGGNFGKVLTKLREQGEAIYSLESMKSANAHVGSIVILVMIVINLFLMTGISNDPTVVDTVRNTVTGQVIAVSNAAAIMFGLYMIRNINSLST